MSGPTAVAVMLRKLRNSSFLSSALTTTWTCPSATSVATVNLPEPPAGRIDQRTIWPKSLSYIGLAVQSVVQRAPASLVKATALPSP